MSETAKQGTSKGRPASAATESSVPEPTAQTGQEATDTRTAQTEATEGAPEPGPEAAKPDLDETKRKFREALERKNHAHTDGQGQGGRDNTKISGAHGPVAGRRNFRRKSG